MEAAPYDPSLAAEWDAVVSRAATGTLLHTRGFLEQHGDRFVDRSLVFRGRSSSAVCAVLPLAVDPGDPTRVVSHPGSTYGGLVHVDRRSGVMAQELLRCAATDLLGRGHRRLTYKAVPPHLHRRPEQADLQALWTAGAAVQRRDLWNVVDLRAERRSAGRRRSAAKALADGVTVRVATDDAAYATFHAMLVARLAERHDVAPVHDLPGLLDLRSRLGEAVELSLASAADGTEVAGAWTFDLSPPAVHTQYLATTAEGRRLGALDVLLEQLIVDAAGRGTRWLSFGASTVDGRVNDGLFRYKASFGGGCFVHDHYDLDLEAAATG